MLALAKKGALVLLLPAQVLTGKKGVINELMKLVSGDD